MRTVNLHAAKTHLSRLVEQAAIGEEIIIANSGKPVARLYPLTEPPRRRQLGILDGKIKVPDNFDELYKEINSIRKRSGQCSKTADAHPARHPHFDVDGRKIMTPGPGNDRCAQRL